MTPIRHGVQPAQNVAEIRVGFDTVATATLNDRVDYSAPFSRVGVAEKNW
jgi:hypothetical protein